MRTIHDHCVNGLNEAIVVTADGPGPGGASHNYTLFIPDSVPLKPGVTVHTTLSFQNGPIASPADFNGITNESLLSVLIDRMRGFQHQRKEDGSFDVNSRGIYACRENAVALTHLEEALMWLQKRTQDRMRRGVEGSHKTLIVKRALRFLARTLVARLFFSERQWFRRLHGGQWRRTYVDVPVCACLWLNVPDSAGPDYREGLWRGRADIEIYP